MSKFTLWGFEGSTYVRTIRLVFAEKGVSDYQYEQVNVLAGETRSPAHLARHPFGKVPVLDHNGLLLLETSAITRYLNDVLPGASLVPSTPADRGRMDTVIGLTDSYGYQALIGGVAAYHLFADYVGGRDENARRDGIVAGRLLIETVMRIKGTSNFIAGDLSLADLYLAPIVAYVQMTADRDAVLGVEGFAEWWQRIEALPSFTATRVALPELLEKTSAIVKARNSATAPGPRFG